MSTKINEEEKVVEFGLKSVFFQGLGKASGPPMSPTIQWLHVEYAKLLLEGGLLSVAR